jgi:thiol:disulfide interchange protein
LKLPLKYLLVGLIALNAYLWFRPGPRELIPWREDYAAAQIESAKTDKPLFLYFTASWCGPCQSLKATVWADSGVAAELAKYVPLKLDVDVPANHALAAKYGVDAAGIPFFVVLDRQGNMVRSGVGAVAPEKFLLWVQGKGSLDP